MFVILNVGYLNIINVFVTIIEQQEEYMKKFENFDYL